MSLYVILSLVVRTSKMTYSNSNNNHVASDEMHSLPGFWAMLAKFNVQYQEHNPIFNSVCSYIDLTGIKKIQKIKEESTSNYMHLIIKSGAVAP